ncbi:TonB-dependent receptor [Muricauda sp. SCSIO 64092]|uniref:TonB-dependent receptor n=1 Tax=Allomuricauda sp. SCSIO 64092 TaxID=2908842 RepID=UPI001FF451AA|nr:TonB-dependent receptor [Muricauda sp. SCSIO 64092]UOY08272.1 TonB-dependent receptor [Muricauda sp. SCSIO 64092]
MKGICLAVLLTLCQSIHAQKEYTLSGFVKDAGSGEALYGVDVIVGPSNGTTTNEYGFYSITVPVGTYTLSIGYLGFTTITTEINLDQDIKRDFELTEQTNELDEVVVTLKSLKRTADVQSTEMSVVALKAQTIQKLPAILGEPDVLKSIQLLPGVSSVNEAANGFNVRGGSADQNLVLLDEGIIYNASHLFGFFSVFNTNAVSDVKLYKGGIPSLYGGRLSSVLDIKQREGNSKEFKGLAGIGLISGNVLVEGPINKKGRDKGKGSYMVAGRRSWLDLFTFLSSEFNDTKLFFYDLNLKANYSLNENNRLYLSGYFGRDNFEIDELLGTIWGNASGTLRWTSLFNEKLFFQTSAVYSSYDYNLDNLRSGSEFRWQSNITNFNLKPRLTWYINGNNTLRLGGEGTYYNFKPGEISPLNDSPINPETFREKFALESGAYLDFEQKLSEKISLRYGVRWSNFQRLGREEINQYANGAPLTYNPTFDQYERNQVIGKEVFGSGDVIESYNGLEPRFSARYLINDGNSLKLSYNRMYQYLHLISNTTSATPLDVWAPSGPFLKPQYSDQVALGYFRSFKDNAYDFNLEVYYKDLNDVTDFVDGADLLFTETIETETVQGEGRAYGMEFQLNKNKGNLTGWLSYTLARSESRILGINRNEWYPTNSDQTHEINLVGLYRWNERWDLSANFVFGSGRPVTYPSGRYEQNGLVVADYSDRNGNRLPTYHRLDVGATLNPKKGKKGKWIFSIANLYNRLNASSIFFREVGEVNGVETATGQTEAIKLSFFGIVPSVTYQFKF